MKSDFVQKTLVSAMSNKWKKCPTCGNVRLIEDMRVRCPRCKQSFFGDSGLLAIYESPYPENDSLEKIYKEVDSCKKCDISKLEVNRQRSKLQGIEKVSDLVFVGQNPSCFRKGDRDLYTSRSGRFLTQVLNGAGLDREKIFVTNIVKCSTSDNRTLSSREIAWCSSYILREMKVINPEIIVSLGRVACDFFNVKFGEFKSWRDCRVFGVPHPVFCLRGGVDKDTYIEYFKTIKEALDGKHTRDES